MRSTIVACTLLAISNDAFKVCPVLTRRGLMAKAAAASVALSPLAALAELKKASDADVYARANGGQLTAERVVERLKKGELVDGSSASCGELERLIGMPWQGANPRRAGHTVTRPALSVCCSRACAPRWNSH